MAHKCRATDAIPWRSEINGQPDGDITIGTEDGNGRFAGKHKHTNKDLQGRCYEGSDGLSDRMWFVVPDNDHLYFGVISSNGQRVEGVRLTLSNLLKDTRSQLNGDEDWVGTKT